MSGNPKEILFEEEARDKLKKGIDEVANTVAFTLGPKGRSVGLDLGFGSPKITNDGNSIIDDIELKDSMINMGVSLAKQVANKIKEKSGDGTTTGILLLKALVDHGIKQITAGASPIALKRGMDKTLEKLLEIIDKMAIDVKNETDMVNIATVSASGDWEVGKLIRVAFQKVGNKGVISIEEGKKADTYIEIAEGMEFERGYLSSYFCTNNEKMIVEMNNPLILVTDKKISSVHDLLPLLQSFAGTEKELLIIAEDVEPDVLSTLVLNKLKGIIRVCAIKAPGYGDNRKAQLEDIAILTGAVCFSEGMGTTLKNLSQDDLGTAEKVVISKDKTTIIGGKGLKEEIHSRVTQIEAQIKNNSNTYEIDKLNERKAKISSGVAVIYVGGQTELEMKQKKQVFEDSLNATRAALEEGTLVGGGVALYQASLNLPDLKLDAEEMVGANILINACSAPICQIITNAGFNPFLIIDEMLEKGDNFGFNVESEKIEDLVNKGIIDPAKVVKSSLIYSVSVAGIVLLTEALITDAKED